MCQIACGATCQPPTSGKQYCREASSAVKGGGGALRVGLFTQSKKDMTSGSHMYVRETKKEDDRLDVLGAKG